MEVSQDVIEEDKEEEVEEEKNKDDDEATPRPSISTNHNARMSKFLEGSMNERSFGIASSWFQESPFEGDKPLPPTPESKHVRFSCTPVREALDEPAIEQEATTAKKRERKGLRRSMSNFNFQAISEKIKTFTGSSHDIAAEAGEKKKLHKPDPSTDLLNERKRKAEEAYVAQFGTKKQKFTKPATTTAPSPNVGNTQPQSRNLDHTPRTLRSSRRSIATSLPSPGLRKKKSRRELERENADLRARLAQQDHNPSAQAENFVRGRVVMVSPGKQRGKLGEDVPPVPQLPGRGVLKVLENSKRNSKVLVLERKSEELKVDERRDVHVKGGRKSFEWPEDVF
jgi:hypothetical protein